MKSSIAQQMPLQLDFAEEMTFANFYAGRNRQLVSQVEWMAKGRGEPQLFFWGREAVGKTHLLQAAIRCANEKRLLTFYLPLKNISALTPQVFENLDAMYLVCVDDLDRLVGDREWEQAFFGFYNRMYDAKKRLIISSSRNIPELNILLPDLRSRLSHCINYQLNEMSEMEIIAALSQRAKNLGIILSEQVLHYLMTYFPRDLGSLLELLSKLDHASLEQKRRITIPFIKEVLQKE